VKSIRHKHKVYRKYKDRDHPACIKPNKKARAEIKKARIYFERKLANSIESNTKSFFAYVKRKSKAKIKVGPILDCKGVSISASEDMCNEFNDFLLQFLQKKSQGL